MSRQLLHFSNKKRIVWLFIYCGMVCFFYSQPLLAQTKDSAFIKAPSDTLAVKKKKHSPALASILSTVCPGAGQIYNRKYWKLPIVWGGVGAFGYLFISQNTLYQKYKRALIARLDDDPLTMDTQFPQYTDAQMLKLKENTNYNRDLMAVLTGLFYVLNIVDASVDGHLYEFDVSENLSINLEPLAVPLSKSNTGLAGISLTFTFN